MPSLSTVLLLAAALAGTGGPAELRMAIPRPVARGVDAFPRIAAPADESQRRINAAVQRLDARAAAAVKDCLGGRGTHPADWARQVEVTMHGPDFVSYLVTDDVDCGGAHPNNGHSAIVYDLATGAPVDWTRLLPASLTGALALTEGEDGVKVVTLASPRLWALYRAEYDRGPADENDAECRAAVAAEGAGGPVPMLAWLDAATGGLAVQFDLPHAEQACSEPVVIPVAALRREGASPRLLAALAAAHAGRSRGR